MSSKLDVPALDSPASEHTLVHRSESNSARSSLDWTIGEEEQQMLVPPVTEKRREPSPRRALAALASHGDGLIARHGPKVKTYAAIPVRFVRQLPRIVLALIVFLLIILGVAIHPTATPRIRAQINAQIQEHFAPTSASPMYIPANAEMHPDRVGRTNGIWPDALAPGRPTQLCDICDCTVQPGFYHPKPEATRFAPRSKPSEVFPDEGINLNTYMRQTLLDIYCARQHMYTHQSKRLLRRTGLHFDQMASWNLTGLEQGKPTVYLSTSTAPVDKTDVLRPQFMRRHARVLQDWVRAVRENGADWQVLWVISEDELDIDPELVRTIQRIGVPYVYFAYGPTNNLANAQKNAVLQLVYALSRHTRHRGLFGHGPVYGLDDDNKITLDLMDMLISVKRIGVLPVGNLGAGSGYERPIVSGLGEVQGSESPWWSRKFPFDYGGYVFNSSLLGEQISGPDFWKYDMYGGESEFINQVVGDIRELEPLCLRPGQDCRVVWHNEPLTEVEKLTDKEEDEFLEKFGEVAWQQHLREQLAIRDQQRGY